jgi:hypothetical protein
MSADHDAAPSLAHVVGQNAKRLRGAVSGDRLASAAHNHGLKWGTGRIADLEAGRVSPTLSTLVSLALALGDIRSEPITLAELVFCDGFVAVTGDLTLSGEALARFVSGEPVQVLIRDVPGGLDEVRELLGHLEKVGKDPRFPNAVRSVSLDVHRRSGEAEGRAAKSLGVDPYDLSKASAHLWGKSLSDERDERAGQDATAQKRGRITRQLYGELKAALNGDD